MPKFYYKCAALLLAVGMLVTSMTAFAQAPEKTSSPGGLSSTDGDQKPAPVVYTSSTNDVPYSTTCSQWELAEMPTPRELDLFRADMSGNWNEMKTFGIEWDEQEYNSGLATGAASFTITGEYFPLSPEDKALWDQGLILVDAKPILEIHVTQEVSLPFTVELGYDVQAEGYYPIFSFPMPHGASHVLFEASNDGTTWISETQKYNTEGFADKRNVSSMQWLTSEENHFFSAHQTSYYRVTVYGSAYDVSSGADGSVSTFILNGLPPEAKPPDSDLDDSGGNRGGVGQEETDRVLPPEDEAAKNAGYTAGSRPGEAAKAPSHADSPSDTPDTILGSSLEEASSQQAITVIGETAPAEDSGSSAKPAIPGAVTAAVCTVGVIIAALLQFKSHRKQG